MSRITRGGLFWFGIVLAVALLFAQADPVAAGSEWCADDPIVAIDGKVVSIITAVHGEAASVRTHVKNAHVVIYVPKGASTRLIATTNIYFPETVEFRVGSWLKREPSVGKVDIEIYVSFTSTKLFASQAQVFYRGQEWAKNSATTAGTIKIQTTIS